MDESTSYNGYKNWDTWNVNLWLKENVELYARLRDLANHDEFKEFNQDDFNEFFREAKQFTQTIPDNPNCCKVDYYQLFEVYKD